MGSWSQQLRRQGELGRFAAARLLRIVPAFLFVLVVSSLVIGPLFSHLGTAEYFASTDVARYITKNLAFSSDMVWTLPGVFADHGMTAVNGSLWTLPAEMRMYLLVAALGIFGLLPNRGLGTVSLVAIVVAGLVHPRLLPVHEDWLRLGAFLYLGILAQLHKGRIEIRDDVMLALGVLSYISYNTDSFRGCSGSRSHIFVSGSPIALPTSSSRSAIPRMAFISGDSPPSN